MWLFFIFLLFYLLLSISFLQFLKVNTFTWSNQNFFFLELNLDSMNFLFFSAVVLVSLLVFNWAKGYMTSKFKLSLFFSLLFIFVSSMLLLTLSESIFSLFIGWEGLGVSSFALIMFYQNWMSAKGALLTLLTNRLGDSIFMLAFCYWISSMLVSVQLSSSWMLLLVVLVSFTKSAQWPFMNWLPAAMAAPTPVSALVHSSTLVTAGVWLMIRFFPLFFLSFTLWMTLGVITLLVASMAALSEKDGKKVVALSTLSQLGMLFISLSMGNIFICLFHILMHAFAKANLFMVVGELLHKSFSQQDSRQMNLSGFSEFLSISMIISIINLTGFLFSSGFFSKEQILIGHYLNLSSVFSMVLVVLIISLTFAYCVKFVIMFSQMNENTFLSSNVMSMFSFFSILLLSMISIVAGWSTSLNLSLYSILHFSFHGWYWVILLMGFLFMNMSKKNPTIMMMGFSIQSKNLDFLFLETLKNMKSLNMKLESSMSEILFLVLSIHLGSLWKQLMRVVFILVCMMVLLSLM